MANGRQDAHDGQHQADDHHREGGEQQQLAEQADDERAAEGVRRGVGDDLDVARPKNTVPKPTIARAMNTATTVPTSRNNAAARGSARPTGRRRPRARRPRAVLMSPSTVPPASRPPTHRDGVALDRAAVVTDDVAEQATTLPPTVP